MKKILVINTGSTSTKVAIFHDRKKMLEDNLKMPEEELKHSLTAVDQLLFRTKEVSDWLRECGYSVDDLDIIAARGGALPPVHGGAYRVNQKMVDVLKYAPASRHESSLSCMIGDSLARGADMPVIIYDSISVDELQDIARYTGFPELKNRPGGHILNTRRVGRSVAKQMGLDYCNATFIIVHLGGSITVTAHEHGRIIDCVTGFTGPMSSQRAGRIQQDQLVQLCYSGKYTEQQLMKILNGGSGFMGYFGTQDARVVGERIRNGDILAKEVTETMGYQTAKAVAEMRIAVNTPVDRIIITGGMANFQYIVNYIEQKVNFIAPVVIVPGEYEMEALAEGALNVLEGREKAKEYDIPPIGYDSFEQFYEYVNRMDL